jgi:hypothetical protein
VGKLRGWWENDFPGKVAMSYQDEVLYFQYRALAMGERARALADAYAFQVEVYAARVRQLGEFYVAMARAASESTAGAGRDSLPPAEG